MSTPLLSQIEVMDPLLMDEDTLMEIADALDLFEPEDRGHYRGLYDPEDDNEYWANQTRDWTPTVPQDKLVNRFANDEAITQFCTDNYLDYPMVSKSGEVTAYSSYKSERIRIGWIK